MFLKNLRIQNFKSFKDVNIIFNEDVNIFTGANNSGKTTVLEAIALWHECFTKLITQAKSKERNYKKGDWILGPSYNKYFPFDEINSVRSPFFEDIFFQREKRNKILINATLENSQNETIDIPFSISSSGSNYVIQLANYSKYPHKKFNDFFSKLPEAIGIVYASPIVAISSSEDFYTDPVIKSKIIQRESFLVIRNRLYKLLTNSNSSLTASFIDDLNYILFNNEKQLYFHNRSNIQKDKRVLINFHINSGDSEKDIALLGSGSLQTIEILLNLYQPGEALKELSLILLDEPDSHIHRDIQMRLIDVIKKFGRDKQIFISTHNEALIRSSDYQDVFHLSGKPTDEVKPISSHEISKISPRFKGIYPSQINPVIRSIGSTTGLDFINAIECDKLVFVEGEDDARILSILLKQAISNRKKYMFWVLGGVSEVFENIISYKKVFSNIKNGKSLWEKSNLFFDRDFISDDHLLELLENFKNVHKIPAYSCTAYTFEATIFTDFEKLSKLISEWFKLNHAALPAVEIEKKLLISYKEYKAILEARYKSDEVIENTVHLYRNLKTKSKEIFAKELIRQNDVQLSTLVRNNTNEILAKNNLFQLMNKDDVGFVINKVTFSHGLTFSIETDFIELIKLVNKSTWFEEWDFINSL